MSPGGLGQFEEMMAEATRADLPERQSLVHDLTRLSRTADKLQSWRRRLQLNGVTIVYVRESETRSPGGKAGRAIRGGTPTGPPQGCQAWRGTDSGGNHIRSTYAAGTSR